MRFLNDLQPQLDLTYDDVFMVPSRSSVTSRLDVDLSTVDGSGTTIPLVVANMTAIAGRRMAETVARRGGIAVIPQDIPVEVVRNVVGWVKDRHLVHDTAITLERHMTAGEALVLIGKRAHGVAVVVDGPKPVGIVSEKDLTGVDRYTQVHDVMHEDMVVLPDTLDPQEAFERLSAARRKVAPVVSEHGELVGILTRGGAIRAGLYRPAVDDDVVHALEHLRHNSTEAAAAVRQFTDEELDTAAPFSLSFGAPMTAQFVIEDHALRHAWHHLAKIRKGLGR